MMDLPLVTLELDHDALREIIYPFSMTVRDRGYSPPPTGSWKLVFSTPSKEVCVSTSSVTRQPRLSACSKTLPMDSYSQNELASHIFSQLHSRNMVSSLLEIVFSTLFPCRSTSIPQITSFLSFLNNFSWV
jgi:hypothetical protein